VLGHVRIRTGDKHAPIRDMRQGVPDLLTVHDPFVTITNRAAREAGNIGTSARLGEQLAPTMLTCEHRPQEPSPLLVVAMGHDQRPGQVHEEHRRIGSRSPGLAAPTFDVSVEFGLETHATKAAREIDPREAGVVASSPELDLVGARRVVCGKQRVECRVHGF
jgi:hypothetical protein